MEGHGVKEVVAMPNVYISNAFSLNMLGHPLPQQGLTVRVRPMSLDEVREVLKSTSFTSAVGHASTAEIISLLVGIEVPANRAAISLSPEDKLIVFQIQVRLPEGVVLTRDEVLTLYQEGKASFVEVSLQ